ncbi:MAG: hypothetical protein ACRDHO_15180 [Actinomycetota bacterium]
MRRARTSRLTIGLILLAALVFQPSPARATFPGANGMFAVQVESGPYRDQIVILNPDGSFDHYFPFFEDVHHEDPNWSPDGRWIAFLYDDVITVARPDGGDLARLSEGSTPRWSPDQSQILFNSGRDGNGEVYVMNSNGSGQTNLTKNPAFDGGAEWAPDGSKIAFWSRRDASGENLYTMNADGSGQIKVTRDIFRGFHYREAPFSWSPDSGRIAFFASRSRRGATDIFSVREDGTDRQRLTQDPANDIGPVWGPDGRIAFASNRGSVTTCGRDCNYEIYLMDSDGGHVTRLTNDPEISIPLQWSPDGTQILFTQFDPFGHNWLYVMNADGSGVFPLETRDDLNYAMDWQPIPPG